MRSRKFLFDLAALLPLDLLQIKLGTQPLLRFPRFLKVSSKKIFCSRVKNLSFFIFNAKKKFTNHELNIDNIILAGYYRRYLRAPSFWSFFVNKCTNEYCELINQEIHEMCKDKFLTRLYSSVSGFFFLHFPSN